MLTEFNAGQLSRFVAPWLARVLYVAVRLGFLLSVVTIFPMQVGWGVVEAGQAGTAGGRGAVTSSAAWPGKAPVSLATRAN